MKIVCIAFLFILVAPILAFSHSAHNFETPKEPPIKTSVPSISFSLNSGNFPGVTWVDDIHPIFMRNECEHCHTRGKEATVENLQEFALGIIDENNPDNPFFSYHELVYPEGELITQQGETLRDGQCCWPKDYPIDHQRRIWVGHPERSVLLRKLEHNYYNWNSPPKTLHDGLKLLWGIPMPMWHPKGHQENDSKITAESYEVLPFWKRFGETTEFTLPPLIPAIDRLLIRHWIQNTLQIKSESGFKLTIKDQSGVKISETKIYLVGNYTSIEQQTITDIITRVTDKDGKLELIFPAGSIVSSTWFVTLEKPDKIKKYQKLELFPNNAREISVEF